jgi:hypothetical protein
MRKYEQDLARIAKKNKEAFDQVRAFRMAKEELIKAGYTFRTGPHNPNRHPFARDYCERMD